MSKFDRTRSIAFYNEMIDLGMRGLSLKECGEYHGVDDEDWIEWCQNDPLTEVKHRRGKAQGLNLAGKELLSQIKAGKINAITFYLKTQGNFTEKASIPALPPSVVPLPSMPSDPVEASKVYQEFMKDS